MINKIREEKEWSKERKKKLHVKILKTWKESWDLETLGMMDGNKFVPYKYCKLDQLLRHFGSRKNCLNKNDLWLFYVLLQYLKSLTNFFIAYSYTCGTHEWWEVGKHYVRNWLYNLLMKFLVEDSSDFIKRRSSLVTSIEFNIWSILSICDSTFRSKEVDWLNKSPIAHFKYKVSSIR